MRLETADGKRIVVTSNAEASSAASFRLLLQMPDGSELEVTGTVEANANRARAFLHDALQQLLDKMVDAGWFPGGLRQVDPPSESADYTMELRLCDDEGLADLETHNRLCRQGGHTPWVGEPFSCTGSAHLAGEHIRCTSSAHRYFRPEAAPVASFPTATATAIAAPTTGTSG